MRYIFIVNPAAGKKDPYKVFFPEIQKYMAAKKIPYICHLTKGPKHAAELAAREGGAGDAARIYGLGGDGTLNEIAAGAAGLKNVEIGIFPCGSGNDYIKTFGSEQDFLSPRLQISAPSRPVDIIRSGREISVNLCTVGMDAKVPLEVEKLKKWPFLSGSAAYDLALVKVLLGKIGDDMKIVIDGEKQYEGCFLMVVAGNGRYYGGGYCGAPKALPDDGLLDFVLIRKPAFYRIPRLVKLYKAGQHLSAPEFNGLLTFCRGKKIEIFSDHPLPENRDGECRLTECAAFEVDPGQVRFITPSGGKTRA